VSVGVLGLVQPCNTLHVGWLQLGEFILRWSLCSRDFLQKVLGTQDGSVPPTVQGLFLSMANW